MDKENGNSNINDILKLLKNTVENTPNADDSGVISEEQKTENMDTELLKETLRNKFMSENATSESEESADQQDEYAIDESFISDAEEEPMEESDEEIEEEIEEEPEEEIEEDNSNVGDDYYTESDDDSPATNTDSDSQIIGIAIPWVDSIPESPLDEDDLDDEYDPDDDEDDDDGGFVMFVDGKYSDDTHNYDGDEEDEENDDEVVELDPDEDDAYDNDDEYDEEDSYENELSEVESESGSVTDAEDPVTNDDVAEDEDDVPWYDTPDRTVAQESTEIFLAEKSPAAEDDTNEYSVNEFSDDKEPESDAEDDLCTDDETESEEEDSSDDDEYEEDPFDEEIDDAELYGDESLETEEEKKITDDISYETDDEFSDELEEIDDIEALEELEAIDGIELSEDDANKNEFEDSESISISAQDDDYEDGESFYRTMVEANALWDKEYANSRFVNISDIEEGEESYLAPESLDVDAYENEKSTAEELQLPEFLDEEYTTDTESSEEESQNGGKEDIPADFYGLGETDAHPDEDKHFESAAIEPEIEYETGDESENIFVTFGKSKVWKIAKPILLCILGLAVFILELLPILNVVPDGILDYSSYPWLYILIDIQLLVFMSAICFGKIKEGIANMFSRTPRLWSIVSATVCANLLHSIVALFCALDGMPYIYNSISAIYLIASTVFDMLDDRRIENSMQALVSDEERIFALKHSCGQNSCAEKMYQGGIDPDTDIFEPVQVGKKSCEGVFVRERNYFDNNFLVSSIVPIAVFAVFVSVISIVLNMGLVASLNTVIFVFLLLAPLSAIVAHYFPLYLSYLRLRDRGCFIAGYASAKEIADCDAIVFSDKHLFRDCDPKNAGIKLYCEDHKTRELFVCLAAVYASVGGPMENTFSGILQGEKHKVNMIRITRNGFEAVVDSKTNIIVGASEYLSRYGIRTDGADTRESGIIYAAMNSTLCAKISVAYETQPLFEALSDLLGHYGVRTVVQTYDPIITGKYVVKCKKKTKYPISVVHKNVNDYNTHVSDKVARGKTGAFAVASRLRLVELAVFAKSLAKLVKINSVIRVILYAVGALLAIASVLFGAAAQVNMLLVLAYHVLAITAFIYATIICLPISFEQIMEKKKRAEQKKQKKETYNQDEQEEN